MTCQTISTLAQQDSNRYITYCNCGVVHTVWDFMTFHFQLDDFQEFSRTLEKMRTIDGYPPETCDNYKAIIESRPQEDRKLLRIRIDRLWVLFQPIDLLLLVDLVRDALKALDDQSYKGSVNGTVIAHNYQQLIQAKPYAGLKTN